VQIEWLDSAEEDLDRIADYLDLLNPVAAHRIITRVEQAVEKLGLYPFAGRTGREKGTRELVVLRTSYVVVYSVQSEYVAIMHVIHGAQQWPPEA
jgi:toxin ParE1/3/4